MTTYKEREKQRREVEIILAAGRMMAERGDADLNMDDLASAVGISKPTLYQHFKSKDDLVAQVFICGLEKFDECIQRPSTLRPIEQIEAAFKVLLRERYRPGGILANLGPELILTTIKLNPEVAERKKRAFGHLGMLIDAAKAQGEIISDMPTNLIVGSVCALLGLMSNPNSELARISNEVGLESVIDNLIRLVMYGIKANPSDPK